MMNQPTIPQPDNARAKKSANARPDYLRFPPQDAVTLDEVYAHHNGLLVMPCSELGIKNILRDALANGVVVDDQSGCDALKDLIDDVLLERNTAVRDDHDPVNKPKHYMLGELPPNPEWFDVRAALIRSIPQDIPHEAVVYWSEGITYMARMWRKNGLEDARKARIYVNKLIELMESDDYDFQ